MKIIIFILIIMTCGALFAQKLRVVTEEYLPYNYLEDGKIKGMSTEVIFAVLEEAKIPYDIKIHPWVKAYDIALKEPNVLIYSIGRTPEREKLFKWVGEIAPCKVYFYSLTQKKLVINSLNDAKKYKIATIENDFREQYLLKNGFLMDKQLERCYSNEYSVKKLLAGRLDLVPENDIVLSYLLKREGKTMKDVKRQMMIQELSSKDLYMALSVGTSDEILHKLQKALETVKKNGTYNKILTSYGFEP